MPHPHAFRPVARLLVLAAASLTAAPARADSTFAVEPGFVLLFDGSSMAGWKPTDESPETWKLEDGALVTRGPRSHLFYVGSEAPFTDFELRVDVKTEKGANGGIYFHTRWQPSGWPAGGYEAQVNNTGGDSIRTGSLYGVAKVEEAPARDGEWFTQVIRVQGRRITVSVDGRQLVDFTEEPDRKPGDGFERKLSSGTFGLQAHDPGSVVHYRNIRVKRL